MGDKGEQSQPSKVVFSAFGMGKALDKQKGIDGKCCVTNAGKGSCSGSNIMQRDIGANKPHFLL